MRTAITARVALVALAFGAPLAAAAQEAAARDDRLTIERLFGRRDFAAAPTPSVHWLADGASAIEVRRDPAGGSDIVRVDLATGRDSVLVDASRLLNASGERITVEALTLSGDESRALLFHDTERVWRANTRGRYTVVELATGRTMPVTRRPGGIMFAKFSPDARRVAFVRDNDLWVTDPASGDERRLTTDGSDVIINGTTDWVTEEELDLRDAFRWSPDGRRIAFWRFDQTAVPSFPLVDELGTYPEISSLRYPKAGEQNARVQVGVIDLDGGRTTWIDVGADTGLYVPRMEWASADSLWLLRLPRLQNRLDLLMASAATGGTRPILTERDSAWVDVAEPVWIRGGREFLWPSERSGWRQIYRYRRDGTLLGRVTRDGADVTELAGVGDDVIYTVEAAPTPMQRQLFRYRLDGRGARERVTQAPGTHRVDIGPGLRYMVDAHSTAATPPTWTLWDLRRGARVRVLEDNAALAARLRQLAVRPPEFFRIPTPAGDSLNAYRIVPADFDSTRAYPVLMYVYGGPGSQTVTDAWGGTRYLWHQLLAQQGVVVVSVDNRGTGARGRDFEKATYLNLGKLEVDDQIAAARWLGGRPWVDDDRIGIWGWSYGGYMAALAAGRGGDLFDAAISVAPVTDWRLYDTIYTERFMRTPQQNPEGYRTSAPLAHVEGMTADFLLVHGTGDDNVHAQNALQLAAKLQEARKPFQMMFYPNKTHSIAGQNTQAHLYDLMTRFVMERLAQPDAPRTAALP